MKPILVNLNIGDQLTATSCGHVVAELIKFIAHQRLQIPYTYQWLKQVVNKKKMSENVDKKESLQSEMHFRLVSSALENLDFILKSLLQEINGSMIPEEVCIALGSTAITCKEIYRLLLPTVCHSSQCHSVHIATDQKIQREVFKTLVTSDLSQVIFSPMTPTNMYIFIRRKQTNMPVASDTFVPARGCRLPKNTKIVVVDFRSEKPDNLSCCNDFQIFGEVISDSMVNLQLGEEPNFSEIESSETMVWYQSSYVMKGFKDCIVNGSSITNMWLES
ncbi:uncharacterized protein LOC125232789 [Leguminivora glycinivorella]|uniref:uncharacterized protein LOC125232789 n=1 Tax=Leguminivora glycinivorella TaxID=1035111 RepID=UPI00200FC8B8|nr:uncharacterized protein LOC125232789 [Leguminivora glycinivorella]